MERMMKRSANSKISGMTIFELESFLADIKAAGATPNSVVKFKCKLGFDVDGTAAREITWRENVNRGRQ